MKFSKLGTAFMVGCMFFLLSGCDTHDASKEESIVAVESSRESTESTDNTSTSKTDQPSVQKQTSQAELAASMKLEQATIGRVVDGDTVVTTDGRKIRLVGVNTPESTTRIEEYGKEASNYTKSKLTGKHVWLQKDVSETDRYGRILRIIWVTVPTNDMDEAEIRAKMYNADLVINGYAEPSTYPPDVKYSQYFVTFAREARKANRGLWSYDQQGTTKGDLDREYSGKSSSSSGGKSSNDGVKVFFQNCTELRKVYPNGVPSTHPAYQSLLDRDKDHYACE
ncbi:thermonuclease family protein [Neobacillus sp. LXY-1]|uniref:thermonuclease family protein n=1 Tax=Neobacillus sp. LXY-1 TaxID=3379133 RepID=UPI003EE2413C